MLCEDEPMTECPVGYLLRTSPHTYDTIDAVCLVENASPTEFSALPRYAQAAARLFRSESVRLYEQESKDKQQSESIRRAARA